MNATIWDLLGVDEAADTRELKRAYARRLKSTRPDEDPQAFQRLSEAFEQALAYARARSAREAHEAAAADMEAAAEAPRAQSEVATATAEPIAAAANAPTVPAPVPSPDDVFHFEPFFNAMAALIRARDPAALRHWLQSNEALYAIDLKWALVPHLFDTLAHHAESLDPSPRQLAVLRDFFGIDARVRRHPALSAALDHLEARSWDPQSSSLRLSKTPRAAFDALVDQYASPRADWVDRRLLRELQGPTDILRRLMILIVPLFPGRLARLLAVLWNASPDDAEARLDARALAFWRGVCDVDRFDARRLLLPLLRAPFLVLPIVAYINLVSESPSLLQGAAGAAAWYFAGTTAWIVGSTAWRRALAFVRRRMAVDALLVVACALFAFAVVSALRGDDFWPLPLVMTWCFWMRARSFGSWLAAGAAGVAVYMVAVFTLQSFVAADGDTWPVSASFFFAVGLFIAVDVLLARRRRMAVAQVRVEGSGLAWSTGAALAFATVVAVIGQVVR